MKFPTPVLYRIGSPRALAPNAVECVVDLGFDITHHVLIRLTGVRVPGKHEPGYQECWAFTKQWLRGSDADGWALAITSGTGHSRCFGVIINSDGVSLNAALEEFTASSGYAR